MTRGPAVQRAGENRQAIRDAGYAQLVGCLLDRPCVASGVRWRQEQAVRCVREAFHGSEDPDQTIELVVKGLQLVVSDRPVVAEAVEALAPEIVRPHAQRDAAPMIRAAAKHSP